MKTEIVKDSAGKKYQKYNDTHYHMETPEELIRVLDDLRQSQLNVRIYYGDTKTGKVWNEEHNVRGSIGRSTGMGIPLIVHPLSYGGPGLLDHCILKIVTTKTKSIFYQHPKFQQPIVTIEQRECDIYPYSVLIDGELYGRCKTERQAKLLRTKMS